MSADLATAIRVRSLVPESLDIPVANASVSDWNNDSYGFEPWGVSRVRKDIDVSAEASFLRSRLLAPLAILETHPADMSVTRLADATRVPDTGVRELGLQASLPMHSVHVVNLVIEYLDQCEAAGQQPTLVGMHWCIDGRNKTMPLLGEVNEALSQRPQLLVSRQNGIVIFSAKGTETAVTADDMQRADKQYRAEFAAELLKLKT